jgi:hypothetical protein
VDNGFLERGRASGTHVTANRPDRLVLPKILNEVAAIMDRSFL